MGRPSVKEAATRRTPGRTPGRASMRAKEARERILDAVDELFYRDGVRAVGVDSVIEHAGVNKMSLYRNFASKDELIAAYLEARNVQYWAWWDDVMQRHGPDARRQLYGLFEELQARTSRKGYRGCAFINVATELSDASHPARRVVTNNKRELKRRLRALGEAADAKAPEVLADSLMLLIEGAYAGSQSCGPDGPVLALARTARVLIDAQCRSKA
jgi:AcrR family transcriptional regulator